MLHLIATWAVLHSLSQVQYKCDQVNSDTFSCCRGIIWWQCHNDQCVKFFIHDCRRCNKKDKLSEGEELMIRSSAANKVPAAAAACTGGHNWDGPYGLELGLAGVCSTSTGSFWHSSSSQVGLLHSKVLRKKEKKGHINHCCLGEQLPELGLDSTAAFL